MLINPYGLDVGKLLDAVVRKLTTKARFLDPAAWKAWVAGDHSIDKAHAAVQLADDMLASFYVSGPNASA